MPPEKNQDKQDSKPLRTFQSDVEEMLKGGQGSLTKIAIAENEKRIRSGNYSEETTNPASEGSRTIIWTSISLFAFGIMAIAVIFFLRNFLGTKQITIPGTFKQIITTDIFKSLDLKNLNREQITSELVKEREENTGILSSITSIGMIKNSVPEKIPVSTEDFLKMIESHASDELARSLDENFLFGIHALSTPEPFMILRTSYYQSAFAGMLAWEKNMEEDLGPIFIRAKPKKDITISTSDDLLKKERTFEDMVVRNRDVRALRDGDGKIIFLYSFADKKNIILTTNADTLQEVAERIIASKMVQ